MYRDVQKSMFKLMFNAEKQADMESIMSVPAPARIPPQQYQYFLTQSYYVPVPPRLKPVNNPAESRSTPD
ncbi:hypothetical protein DPMN_132982 [Dreissena polymorpha]|uniref:Uncharacterized protein n=1 Tax=Dreissena polymorpha TaxID=45954 RepID=A0A9D4JCJ0_DREPO|nr:hypothetical protein DPMN_132982 [Dreissena polymorpha]